MIDIADVIDGTADEIPAEVGQELATRQVTGQLTVAPQAAAEELVQRLDVIRDAMHNAMVKDVDYGVIPGTNKPTLLKPGAEKLGVLFQLDVQLDNQKDYGPGEHLTCTSQATVFHIPTGTRLGSGEGLCTTREKKYGKRKQERVCPTCGAAAIIKGKSEFGGGWTCWKKRDGCGAKFRDGDQAIEGQEVKEIENPDLPDLWNTVIKMAEKRARVDAILAVTGASALFTQDAEDRPRPESPPSPVIDKGRAGAIMGTIGELLGLKAIDGPRLSEIFTASGATPSVVNAAAVEALTEAQAALVEDALAALSAEAQTDR